MEATYLLAIDLGKRHFQVCGTGVNGVLIGIRRGKLQCRLTCRNKLTKLSAYG
ncbi:hypothetical protein GCM10011317_52990 [Niveispirillum cyanobacteriorum]|nr:hypothetical protein GCM10011317_52990 [Niveispirillum cyanobacteriorum]